MADETVAQRLQRAVDGLGMTLEAGFAPADRALVGFDPNEKPARRDPERLDAADLHVPFLTIRSRDWRPR
jgi:hypothetical protein